jgi:hypothetical protein
MDYLIFFLDLEISISLTFHPWSVQEALANLRNSNDPEIFLFRFLEFIETSLIPNYFMKKFCRAFFSFIRVNQR